VDLELHTFNPDQTVTVAGFPFQPLPLPHGDITVYGFRVDGLGYVTDAKLLPQLARDRLRGVRVLVLNALWFGRSHPTHFNIEEAVEAAREIGAETTYLTHLTHRVTHQELLDRLPAGILPAYDGLEIMVPES
jgi:phosphoribosyl 1,2-cyclic phosphate phosphodiesterase